MGWYLEYIEKMRARPGLYLGGDDTVENHRSFMSGYQSARIDLGLSEFENDDLIFLEHFRYWLVIKFNNIESYDVYGLINKDYHEFAETYIEAFYMLFDEYKKLLETVSFEQIKEEYDKFLEKRGIVTRNDGDFEEYV